MKQLRADCRSHGGAANFVRDLGKTDFIDDPVALEQNVAGATDRRVERYGKFMLLRLSASHGAQEETAAKMARPKRRAALLVHLGMTGQLAPCPAEQPLEKHTHVRFVLDDGRELRYTDPRRFGRMAYLAGALLATELTRFGAEPLQVSTQEFARRVRSSRARIKALLLDQSVLARSREYLCGRKFVAREDSSGDDGRELSAEQGGASAARIAESSAAKRFAMRGSSISDFLDARASRAIISGTIEHTDAKESNVFDAGRRFGERLSRDAAVIFVRSASRRRVRKGGSEAQKRNASGLRV